MKNKIFKIKFKSFTLMEMMVTLTIFSITLTVIYNLMGMSVRILDRFSSNQEYQTEALLFTKIIDKILRNSWEINEINKYNYTIKQFPDKEINLINNNNLIFIIEKENNQITSKKVFNLKNSDEIKFEIYCHNKRKYLYLKIKQKNNEIEKYILLGYKKTNTKNNNIDKEKENNNEI